MKMATPIKKMKVDHLGITMIKKIGTAMTAFKGVNGSTGPSGSCTQRACSRINRLLESQEILGLSDRQPRHLAGCIKGDQIRLVSFENLRLKISPRTCPVPTNFSSNLRIWQCRQTAAPYSQIAAEFRSDCARAGTD